MSENLNVWQDKILLAKVKDKILQSAKSNKIQTTDFLNLQELSIVEKFLKQEKIENYILFGGCEEAERKAIVFYPSNWKKDVIEKKIDSHFTVIEIVVAREDIGAYTHRNYLGALMKLGVKREKIGDILVENTGADIIVCKEIEIYLLENLGLLTRFQNATIKKKELKDVRKVEIIKKEREIIVSSMRLDNIVSELAKCSRSKANDLLQEERVYINYRLETKKTKLVKSQDKITIRGKGRFYIKEELGTTRSGRQILKVEVSS